MLIFKKIWLANSMYVVCMEYKKSVEKNGLHKTFAGLIWVKVYFTGPLFTKLLLNLT